MAGLVNFQTPLSDKNLFSFVKLNIYVDELLLSDESKLKWEKVFPTGINIQTLNWFPFFFKLNER